jgi:hypothetical protein
MIVGLVAAFLSLSWHVESHGSALGGILVGRTAPHAHAKGQDVRGVASAAGDCQGDRDCSGNCNHAGGPNCCTGAVLAEAAYFATPIEQETHRPMQGKFTNGRPPEAPRPPPRSA